MLSQGLNQVYRDYTMSTPTMQGVIQLMIRLLIPLEIELDFNAQSNWNPKIGMILNSPFELPSLESFAKHSKLDRKQNAAFQTVSTSYMLNYHEDDSFFRQCEQHTSASLLSLQTVKPTLIAHGAMKQLLMFLTGPGWGLGGSHVIAVMQRFCKHFCDALGLFFMIQSLG